MSNDSKKTSKIQGYFSLAGGVLISLTILIFLDVQIALSKIDANDSETWTNMNPGIQYFFIPIIFFPVYICSAFVIFICEKFIYRTSYKSWFFQGLGCGMIMSFLPIAWLDIPVSLGISLPIILTVGSLSIIRMKCRNDENS